MKMIITLLAALALTGCAFCQTHETVCRTAVAVVVIAGAVALAREHDEQRGVALHTRQPPPDCAANPALCH